LLKKGKRKRGGELTVELQKREKKERLVFFLVCTTLVFRVRKDSAERKDLKKKPLLGGKYRYA